MCGLPRKAAPGEAQQDQAKDDGKDGRAPDARDQGLTDRRTGQDEHGTEAGTLQEDHGPDRAADV